MDWVAHTGYLVHGFSKQEYWSGLPCLPPGDLPDPRIEPGSPAPQADSLLLASPGKQPHHGYSLITQTLGSILNTVGQAYNNPETKPDHMIHLRIFLLFPGMRSQLKQNKNARIPGHISIS